ncbi:inhibitor of nuclear factor kappa B kinase subunit beta [Nomia melanderi]|uniref:inhibitor of nuclear factor kappa B kinase subunit beta n=1 Tax=Nomia melanderi TaxID=2448451 RepID=UPI0013041A0E|nr:inhibitor of nuclear factor kappa-B kinase subunit alpha [Nomia melanderi]
MIAASVGNWTFNKTLGSGGFGIVELWTHTSGSKLAIKKCKWDMSQLTETQRKRWINEVQIMNHLKHSNIVKSIELPFKYPDEKIELPLLCMEFCRKGDLRTILNKPENCCGMSEKEVIVAMKNISSAVEYLHSNNITHRDLKPENIVLQDEHDGISYKLIDLGYAKELGEASSSASIVGTLNYVAPELLWKQKYSCSVDYWSLGILFYELVTGRRPFLPWITTITWIQYIKDKGYEDICAFESEGKIIFGQNIMDPTNLSRCLRNKLVEWFRVMLQWDPKQRGKKCDENGVMQLVAFKLLRSILSTQIVHVFSASTYKLNTYEINDITTVTGVQTMIEKDFNIPINQQILTNYFGKILISNEKPLWSQIQDPVLFMFKKESTLIGNIPVSDIPKPIQKMIELSRSLLNFDTLSDYYRMATFFIKQELHLLELYIFALTIKVDLVITRLNTFNENITNASTNVNTLMSELSTVREQSNKELVNKEKIKRLEINFGKVIKLVKATDQIKLKFSPLLEESNELKDKAQGIDCLTDISHLYNKAITIYESHKKEHSLVPTAPIKMVKLIFEFLDAKEKLFHNQNILEIIKQTEKLEVELLILERIFDSVIAMTTVYREELQSIIQFNLQNARNSSDKKTNIPVAMQNEATNILTNNDVKISSEDCNNQFPNMSSIACNKVTNVDNVIYDNLVIRYTLDNLLIEMQEKYMDMASLEP